MTAEFEVPALLRGVRIDRAVAMLTGVTRSVAAGLVAEGKVRVDGAVATTRSMPLEGSVLSVEVPPVAERTLLAEPDSRRRRGLRGRPGGGGGQAGRPGGPPRGRPDGGHLGVGAAGPLPGPGAAVGGLATPGGRASFTGSTGAPRACWRWPAPRPPTARSWPSWRPAPCRGATWPWWRATWPRSAGVVEAPIGRSTRTPDPHGRLGPRAAPARTTYRVLGRCHDHPLPSTLLAAHPRHRADPPDPGAPGGHRPPGGGRRPLRRPGSGWGARCSHPGRLFLHAAELGFDHPATDERLSLLLAAPRRPGAGSVAGPGRGEPTVRRPGGRRRTSTSAERAARASSSARRTRRTPTPSRSAVACSDAGESPPKPKRSRSTSRWMSGSRSTALAHPVEHHRLVDRRRPSPRRRGPPGRRGWWPSRRPPAGRGWPPPGPRPRATGARPGSSRWPR